MFGGETSFRDFKTLKNTPSVFVLVGRVLRQSDNEQMVNMLRIVKRVPVSFLKLPKSASPCTKLGECTLKQIHFESLANFGYIFCHNRNFTRLKRWSQIVKNILLFGKPEHETIIVFFFTVLQCKTVKTMPRHVKGDYIYHIFHSFLTAVCFKTSLDTQKCNPEEL